MSSRRWSAPPWAWSWTLRIVAFTIIAGLAIYFWKVGADEADKVGGAISSIVAVIALLLSFRAPQRERPTTAEATTPDLVLQRQLA